MTIGECLKEKRLKRGIGVRELARSSGVAASTIVRIEQNKIDSRIGTIVKIADTLGVQSFTINWD